MTMVLSLREVSKSYWRGRRAVRVLDGVSLDIAPGQFVAVSAGPREGKSTLLQLAAGLEPVDAGTVSFEGKDLAAPVARRIFWPWPRRLRGGGLSVRREGVERRMAWVRRSGPTGGARTPMLTYVALPLMDDHRQGEAHRRAAALLAEFGVEDLAGATWRELADTERILMTVAHAIARRPALLFADDLTTGLGIDERETVLAVLRQRVEQTGMAVLMTAQTVPETLRAHTVVRLSDGKLVLPSSPPAADVIPLVRRDAG